MSIVVLSDKSPYLSDKSDESDGSDGSDRSDKSNKIARRASEGRSPDEDPGKA